MRPFRYLLVSLLVAAWPHSAAAGTWSFGSNLGFMVNSNQNATETVVAWPGDVLAFQPGLRIGYVERTSPLEFYMDTGFLVESSSGSSFRIWQASGNFQHGLNRRSASGPYLTGGVGFWMIGGSNSETHTVGSLGGGLGARAVVGHGHGAFRGELRIDHFFEDQAAGVDAFTAVGVKLGFDLWMR
ncbi:MAG TPA: hypothetical protein VGK89_07065 [Candidatus Eisenbacteria bacterium]|jgi:hypothetical protein